MIERLIQTDVSTFDRDSLRKLKSYFDINIITCTLEQRRQWFENLYVLAQHDLSVAQRFLVFQKQRCA